MHACAAACGAAAGIVGHDGCGMPDDLVIHSLWHAAISRQQRMLALCQTGAGR